MDNLTEASVDIVASGNCLQQMNLDLDDVDSLIVCASSANQGPCKVNILKRRAPEPSLGKMIKAGRLEVLCLIRSPRAQNIEQ